MERLTIKTEAGYDRTSIRVKNQQLIDKLAYYEDLEEQGKLMIRPCNPGDTLYIVDSNRVYTVKAENNVVIISGELNIFVQNTPLFADYVCQSDMGKRAFFTSEEAETKLKELQNKQ